MLRQGWSWATPSRMASYTEEYKVPSLAVNTVEGEAMRSNQPVPGNGTAWGDIVSTKLSWKATFHSCEQFTQCCVTYKEALTSALFSSTNGSTTALHSGRRVSSAQHNSAYQLFHLLLSCVFHSFPTMPHMPQQRIRTQEGKSVVERSSWQRRPSF